MSDNGFRQRVIEFIELARVESDRYLSNYSPEEIETFRGMGLLDETLEKLKSSQTDRDKKRALESRIVAEGLRCAVMIREIIAGLDRIGGPEQMNPWNISEAMYRIGFAHATLHNLSLRLHPDYQSMIHGVKAAEIIGETRYREDREYCSVAIETAEQYWKEGGQDLHHVMAKRLAKQYLLNENSLKKRLAPIARKYGRCFGEKGITKNL